MNTTPLKLIIGAAVIALAAGSCSNRKAATQASEAENLTITTDSISWSDSIKSTAGSEATCQISVGYPADGPSETVDSIRTWIAERLSTSGSTSPDSPAPYAAAAANFTSGPELIKSVGTEVLKQAKTELSEFEAEMEMNGISYEYIWNIFPNYQTDSVITYTASTYAYLGGAHGSSFAFSQVFEKPSGKRLGWNMFKPEALPKLTAMIKTGLMTQYFEVPAESDLAECLLIDPDTLPLPVSNPAFLESGVVFLYQQYEIAPYAAGMPACTIPYDRIRPLLTPEAAALLPAETTDSAAQAE